ncbi:hypothetical protein RYX36_015002 [Vicia faba]
MDYNCLGARIWLGTYNTAEKSSQAYESKRLQFEMEAKANEEEEACINNSCSINNTRSELEIKEEVDGVAEDEASDMVACQFEELEIPDPSVLKFPEPPVASVENPIGIDLIFGFRFDFDRFNIDDFGEDFD